MKRLNILQIHSAKVLGGGEIHLYQLLRELSKRGHNLTLAIKGDLITKFSNLDIDIRSLPLKNALDLISIFKLVRIIKEKQIDIIHAHRGKDYWLAIMAATIAKRVKVVITRHILKPLGKTYLHHHLYKKVSKIIVVSNEVRDILIKENKISLEKLELIYNGVDLSDFNYNKFYNNSLKQEFNIDSNDIVVGAIGRLGDNKNQEFILEIAAKLKNQISNVKYLIIGQDNSPDNSYKSKLEEMIRKFNLTDQVYLTGFREDIPAIIDILDILIIPSKQEAFGIVAIEAMAMKKVVLATRVGGLKEIIENGKTGFLLPLEVEGFSEKIKQLIEESSLRADIGEAGYQRVLNKYAIETMINKTEELYYDILSNDYKG